VTTTPWSGRLPDLGSIEVEAIELVRVQLPLRAALESAHGVERTRDVVLVRALGADGAEGWGECSALEAPTYTGEYTDGAWAVLRDHLVPAARAGRLGVVRGHPMATTAVEVALTDLELRREGRALVDALAGDGRSDPSAPRAEPGVRWTAVVGVQPSIDELLDRVAQARAHGAAAVKLKVRPGWDLEPVAAVRRCHPDLRLAVDANGSFDRLDAGTGTEDQLVGLARLLPVESGPDDGVGIYVEQPNRPGAYTRDARLLERFDDDQVPVGLALDESLTRAEDVAVVEELLAATDLNVKPARLGGLAATARARALIDGAAAGRPLRPFVGGLLETGVGRATALAVACSWPAVRDTDLGPSSWYVDDDLTEPIELGPDGDLHVPPGPGLGVAPRPDRLADVAVDRLVLRL
jgi:O-succinylbenzoate synthase